jgi:hypothetical protein
VSGTKADLYRQLEVGFRTAEISVFDNMLIAIYWKRSHGNMVFIFLAGQAVLQMPIWVMAFLHESNILLDKQIKLIAFKHRATTAFNAVNRRRKNYTSVSICQFNVFGRT